MTTNKQGRTMSNVIIVSVKTQREAVPVADSYVCHTEEAARALANEFTSRGFDVDFNVMLVATPENRAGIVDGFCVDVACANY